MKNWYALYTRPRHEKKAYDLLLEKGEEAFLPLMEEIRVYGKRKKKVEKPLFPSYLFCHFEYKYRIPILQTHGIIKVVNFNGEPAIIPDWQIDSLKILLENPAAFRMESYLRPGDLVEVKNGPFAGMKGTVKIIKGESRLVLTIEGIMQSISVEVDRDLIKTLSEGEKQHG